jgi:uncharacterized protein
VTTSGNRIERIQEALRSLRAVSPDILGSAVVSTDGFIIASLLPAEIDEELVCAMAAAQLGAGERIATELLGGAMEQTFVRGKQGYVVLNAVGKDALLIVLTGPDAKLGLVFLDVKRRVQDLTKIL